MAKKKKISESQFKASYSKLLEYCEEKGIAVKEEYNLSDYTIPQDKEIVLNCRSKYENKVYALLHEIGHIFIFNDKNCQYVYSKRAMSMDSEDVFDLRWNLHKIDVIGIELEAWNRGLKIAKNLGIEINRKEFDRYKTKMMLCYVNAFWDQKKRKKRKK